MATPPRRNTITLRDGARATLRPIAPEDKPLLAASFERLSEESRYRRFLTAKSELSAAELAYLVDVDHSDHEAIVAIDPTSGEMLGVARYVRLRDDPEIAEIAVTVADDWQGRGLGRALLDRLTYRARREGVRRFSALVQGENQASLRLLEGVGDTRRESDTGAVELVIELPPERGMGARLGEALRAAAAGSLVPAQTVAHRVAVGVGSAPRAPVRPPLPIRAIVVGVNGSDTAGDAVSAALGPAPVLQAALHIVSAHGALREPADADEALTAATAAAQAKGLEAVAHTRRGEVSRALIAVAEEQDADLVIVGGEPVERTSGGFSGSVADRVSHRAPCSVLIVRRG